MEVCFVIQGKQDINSAAALLSSVSFECLPIIICGDCQLKQEMILSVGWGT